MLRSAAKIAGIAGLALVNAFRVCNTKYQQMAWDSRNDARGRASGGLLLSTAAIRSKIRFRPGISTDFGELRPDGGRHDRRRCAGRSRGALVGSIRLRVFAAGAGRPRSGSKSRRRHQAKKIEAPVKEAAKPQGPLIIAISIDKQNAEDLRRQRTFRGSAGFHRHGGPSDADGRLQRHPERQKCHHSNIYSGAPMPFMQRITWSGVAMHAGVLPGYPASHGCIRMPMAFAVKMWGWTRMGARVVVTPGEMTPPPVFRIRCSCTQKVAPQPVAPRLPTELGEIRQGRRRRARRSRPNIERRQAARR